MTSEMPIVVDVNHLTKSYDNKRVVDDVSLQIKRGEVFGFLGPNGSGKTTTLRMICGLLTPDSGEGTCLGYDIINESHAVKSNIGYMTQRFSLYEDLSIYENLDFIARLHQLPNRKLSIQKSLDSLGINKKRSKQLAKHLSGGWKQRLALAASILHDPKFLLLDEPTAGVDPKARREFWDEIHRLAATGITTLVTTHYMDEAERCHRLAYISYGHLLVVGTMLEVIQFTGLKTWKVIGPKLYKLTEQVQSLPGVTQVAQFGSALHISGVDVEQLDASLLPFQKTPYQWEKITANLEDVFIHYSNSSEDNFQ